ncbi:S9 family peptidase [Zobellia galactanivorans]|uniref:Dipeptidyl-peptidase IV, family S9 n=1 Tax=Zobellia galactanivorans (strain DSM 12802 / CCUG 47099 / CIP 106680 / NCIMB 13871 / Dsij) TaxID=63186 RepID=G0L8M5_ZOBGA|nr:S9 family peptidase [Zobellia galactanivorans]MBU3024205.1 S9 family peptidase [Zobellia galactanivorans]CAZ97685.1 Dipeptidyl-peptidase IV, family S9 [Zobellia galactanivorans]
MKRAVLNVLLAILVFVNVGYAQEAKKLTLADIYKNGEFGQKGYGPIRWMKDNKGYSTLEANKDLSGKDIVKYDAKTGRRSIVVSAADLIPQGSEKPLVIKDYKWSEDNTKLLVFTNTRKVWRYHTRGDYWVLDLATKKLVQLGKTLPEATLMFAKFSPDGSRVGYVSNLNIYVEDLNTNSFTQITKDGGDHIINGTFDWVYEEELNCRDGFRWSPDGEHIAYWQSNTEGVGTFYMINNLDSIYSKPIPMPYPKVGTQLSAVKVGVVPAKGGSTKWFDIPGDPRNNYLARMDFIPNSNEVMIQQLNRPQNTNKVYVANVETLEFKNILTEKDEAFLDIHDDIRWLDNERYFTWSSERDGWLKLYKVSRDGSDIQPITKGDFDVVSINCIDPKSGYVYYIASPDNFTQRYLYRSRIDGKGTAQRVTPASNSGQNSYQISQNAKWGIHVFQNATTPSVYSLVSLPSHKTVRVLEDNKELKEKYDALKLNPKEFVKVDIGDDVLDAFMIKPIDFDPSKKYPLLFYVYGEPAGATVQDNWGGGSLWDQYMAQQGYIVMSVDNRGTKTPRGKKWRNAIYGQIGILASEDQNKAANKIIDTYGFIDPARVGIWGWSGGGQMTLNCMFRYPGTYKSGLAVSFVSDQRLYDATYQERYMGLLSDNAKGYHDGSPINFAQNLEGNLMVIHGTADDNVHYQSYEMLVDKLIANNKIFDMMSYPMRAHGIYERENTSYHLRQTMENFWKENLPAGGK